MRNEATHTLMLVLLQCFPFHSCNSLLIAALPHPGMPLAWHPLACVGFSLTGPGERGVQI